MPKFMVLITSHFDGETQSAAHFFDDIDLARQYSDDTWSVYDCLTDLQIYEYSGIQYYIIDRRCRRNA